MSDNALTKSSTIILCSGWKGVRVRVSIRVDANAASGLSDKHVGDIVHNISKAVNKSLTEAGISK